LYFCNWCISLDTCVAGQLVVIDGTSETISGSAEGDGLGTLDLPRSTVFFAGVPGSVSTARFVLLGSLVSSVVKSLGCAC